MKRRFFLLLFATLLTLIINAKIYIPLVKSVPPGGGGDARVGERSSVYSPLAYYESDTLFIHFPFKTAANVIITNDSTDLTVLSMNFTYEAQDVQIPINPALAFYKPYNLSVNAFGVWWVGYFEYIPPTAKIAVSKGFSGTINNPNSERNYGAFLNVGNAASGLNFGVSGVLSGQNGGTGIYGSSNYDEGFNSGGRFAGLFHGDLKTTDAVFASAYNTLADSRLNDNMEQLPESCLDNLMQVSVYKYDLRQFNVDNALGTSPLGYYNNDSGILEKEHFGLSGQEIKDIYPNLVSESHEGYMSINYVEMVPLLIQSIKELKQELDETKVELENLKTSTKVTERTQDQTIELYQNTPNPFKERCVIKCTIPQNVANATFYLYDLNGLQIQSRNIKERGSVQIQIEADGFEAGIYLYSLVADGKLIDTKRMIHIDN